MTAYGMDGTNAVMAPGNHITSWNLKNNKIGHEGAKAIAEALKHENNKVQDLYISDEGASEIVEALKHENNKVKHLYLSSNQIGDEGTWLLAKVMLHANSKVEDLDLTRNQIGEEAKAALNDALALSKRRNVAKQQYLETRQMVPQYDSAMEAENKQLSAKVSILEEKTAELEAEKQRVVVLGEEKEKFAAQVTTMEEQIATWETDKEFCFGALEANNKQVATESLEVKKQIAIWESKKHVLLAVLEAKEAQLVAQAIAMREKVNVLEVETRQIAEKHRAAVGNVEIQSAKLKVTNQRIAELEAEKDQRDVQVSTLEKNKEALVADLETKNAQLIENALALEEPNALFDTETTQLKQHIAVFKSTEKTHKVVEARAQMYKEQLDTAANALAVSQERAWTLNGKLRLTEIYFEIAREREETMKRVLFASLAALLACLVALFTGFVAK